MVGVVHVVFQAIAHGLVSRGELFKCFRMNFSGDLENIVFHLHSNNKK